jgi:hypothetical protein
MLPSIDAVVSLLKESDNLKEDSKLAIMILQEIRLELAECAESLKESEVHIQDGRAVVDILLELSQVVPIGLVHWPSLEPVQAASELK